MCEVSNPGGGAQVYLTGTRHGGSDMHSEIVLPDLHYALSDLPSGGPGREWNHYAVAARRLVVIAAPRR
jgi:hypothetical protein